MTIGAFAQTSTKTVLIVAPSSFIVPKIKGVTTELSADKKVLSVTGTDAKQTISIDLGWMDVNPNAAYHGTFNVQAVSSTDATGVSLMLREHSAQKQRPFPNYHRTSVNSRPLKPGASAERPQDFVTGDKTHALSGAIVITGLVGELRLSAFELSGGNPVAKPQTPEEAAAEYPKLMAEIRAEANARKPLVPRTLVFSRAQMKYDLGRNYYHEWNDRPLLTNRDYRVPSPYLNPLPSYKRTLEEVLKYDIDGLALMPETKGRLEMLQAHQEANVGDLKLLTEFLPFNSAEAIELKVKILKAALKSPDTPRIDSKILITSYASESLTPAQWKTVLDALRQQVGDTFIFLPALSNVAALRKPFSEGQPITRAMIDQQKATLRSYLDVCDGIYFNYPAAFRNTDRTFDSAFYKDIFIPVFKSVLSEPAYRNKYFGLSAYKSHMAPERGNSLHEDGTRTLRYSFEDAMNAHPDVLVLPEWDEENENTSWRPTIYGSRTSERIVRYYMSHIKSKNPTPIPGDDVTVPNLIFSARKAVSIGENAAFELLNVPDSTTPGSYTVDLKLEDANGKLVHTFPTVTFDQTQLEEHRLYLPTETIPNVRALVPVLTIHGYKGHDLVYDNGLHHIEIRGTWNWDQMYVKQPLRDILRPATATIAWQKPAKAGDPLTLTGTVTSPENLNTVEVLGDDDEAYAVDPKNEFFRDDPTKVLLWIDYRSLNTQEMTGTLTLKNATANWLTNGTPLHQEETDATVNNHQVTLTTPVSIHPRWIYLAIPKADVAKAVLDFNFDKAKFSVPVQEVLDKKMIARGFDGGMIISIKPYHRQIDMPMPLNTKSVSFNVQIWPEIATEEYHLRLTSIDGKTFRSRPLLVPSENSSAMKTLRVYSDAQKKPVDVQVAADRIPDLQYDFDPTRGAVLLTDAGVPFWATLGGFSNSTTGRGAINDLYRGKYPDHVSHSNPQWVTDDGKPCLEFDGVGTYLEIPRGALPWHGSFTIDFDVKPSSSKDQSLLINGTGARQNGFALDIKDGKLQASFKDANWALQRFATQLSVPANTWSTIHVSYDFEKLTFSVNGKSESVPLTLPASNIGFTVIGAGWTGNPFAGRLRNLHIVHDAG